jgi:hypothetical protein
MRVARKADEVGPERTHAFVSIDGTLGRERTIKSVTKKNKLKSLFDGVDKVNVTRLADPAPLGLRPVPIVEETRWPPYR